MLSQRQELKLTQKLSPRQILLMKLLQIPTVSLEQRIKQELEENPALESDDFDDTASTETRDNNDDTMDDVSAKDPEDAPYDTMQDLDDYFSDDYDDDVRGYAVALSQRETL